MTLHSPASHPVRSSDFMGAPIPGSGLRSASPWRGAGFQGVGGAPNHGARPEEPFPPGPGSEGLHDSFSPGASQDPQDRFTPGIHRPGGFGEGEAPLLAERGRQPVLLAQGPSSRDRAQGIVDVARQVTSSHQFPGNPRMRYFPGGYNPTDPTAPASLINHVWEPVNNRLGAAFNPQAQQDAEMVRHVLNRARRDMPDAYYMERERALNYLRERYAHLGDQRLNQLLDNLATQTSNTGLFGRERNWIYADDIRQFLTNRRY